MKNCLVSIIVSTKNEEKNIYNCLKSIKNQTYKNIEVVVVDNYSTDKTKRICSKFKIKFYEKGNERSEQRNYGVYLSKGEFILYLDADMIITPNLVYSCLQKIKNEEVDGLYIKERIIGKNFFNEVRNFEREFYEGTKIDAIRFLKKKKFLQLKGFDKKIIGQEDWDFSIRFCNKFRHSLLKEKIKFNKKFKNFYEKYDKLKKMEYECIIHNESNINLKEHIKKKIYYLKNINTYIDKNKKYSSIIKEQLSISGRLRILFDNKNIKRIILNPIKFIFILIFKCYIFYKSKIYKINFFK